MNAAVFDASVLVKLAVDEPGSPAALSVYTKCGSPRAPGWAMLECAQALWGKARRGEYAPEQMLAAFSALMSIELELENGEPDVMGALALGLEQMHPVYDCAYVMLALEERIPLVTSDRRLRGIAETVGVEVVWIAAC